MVDAQVEHPNAGDMYEDLDHDSEDDDDDVYDADIAEGGVPLDDTEQLF